MDLRALINLLPFGPAKKPLHALLDRIEAMEARLAKLEERKP